MTRRLPLLRTSERKDFKRCPQRWWWGWREGLKPQGPPNDKLWFGEGVHLALALWYKPGLKRGIDPRVTWRKFAKDDIKFIRLEYSKQYDPSKYEEAATFGEELLTHYLDHWGRDQSWDIIAPEQKFEVVIPDHTGKPVVRQFGTFDGVYRDLNDGNRPKLMEHKTAAQIYTGHLELDEQGGTYVTVATHVCREQGLIEPDETIEEITYNFLRKGKKDERPTNEKGQATNKPTKEHYVKALTRIDNWTEPELKKMKIEELDSIAAANYLVVLGDIAKNQPSPLFIRLPISRSRGEQRAQLERIAEEIEVMNEFRTGNLPLWKNPTRDCSWDCDFYEMCVLDESNPDDAEEFKNAVFRVEDPYADHRKSAAS